MANRMAVAVAALVEKFRPLYRAELEELAEELRPRFEAGELRGMTDEDLEDGEHGATSPLFRLEDLCAERLAPTLQAAHLVLALSPSAARFEAIEGGTVPGDAAQAIALDVLTIARARSWYTPTPDECPRPGRERLSKRAKRRAA